MVTPCGEPLQLHVSIRFQILFHRPPGLLFTFPSRYLFTIDHREYLALAHSRAGFLQDFTCPVVLRNSVSTDGPIFEYGAITRYGPTFQTVLLTVHHVNGIWKDPDVTALQHLRNDGFHPYLPSAARTLRPALGAVGDFVGLG